MPELRNIRNYNVQVDYHFHTKTKSKFHISKRRIGDVEKTIFGEIDKSIMTLDAEFSIKGLEKFAGSQITQLDRIVARTSGGVATIFEMPVKIFAGWQKEGSKNIFLYQGLEKLIFKREDQDFSMSVAINHKRKTMKPLYKQSCIDDKQIKTDITHDDFINYAFGDLELRIGEAIGR